MSDESARSRFFVKIRDGATPEHAPWLGPCSVWTARMHKDGYGLFWFQERMQVASRVAFYFAYGRFPRANALHRCDNRACVRPSHIFEGTHADNIYDKCRKGRQANGEGHGMSKLKLVEVLEILDSGLSVAELAARFGVGETAIKNIQRGETWVDAVAAHRARLSA